MPDRLPKGLKRDTLLLLAAQTFYKLSGIVLLMGLSRCLPAGEVGVFFFAVSFAETLLIIANFNLNPALMRQVAATPARAGALLAPILGFRLLSAPVYLLCLGVAAFVLFRSIWVILLVAGVFTLLEDAYFTFGGLFIAYRKVVYNLSIGLPIQTLFLTMTLGGILLYPHLTTFLATSLLRSVLLVVVAAWVCHRLICPLRLDWDRSLLRQNRSFLMLSGVSTLRDKSDTLLLGLLASYSVVGHYNLAYRIVDASGFIPSAVGQALFPRLASGGMTRENRRALVRIALALVGTGIVALVLALVGAVPISRLMYGREAGAVAPLLRLLTVLFPLSFLDSLAYSALQALYREKTVLHILIVGIVVTVATDLVLIPRFGVYGVICAQYLSLLIRLTLFAWALHAMPVVPASDLSTAPGNTETEAVSPPL
jgi:O-antigen/teichoic acid export membrane protein